MIKEVKLSNFRNIESLSLHFHPRLNVIHGDNGSGKSSLLEALYLLGFSYSFRANRLNHIIRHGEGAFTVFAKVQDPSGVSQTLGMQKNQNHAGATYQLNGNKVSVQEWLRHNPTQLLEPKTFDWLVGPPVVRRKFLDWGVFHVEHSFILHWQKNKQALSARNMLLKRERIDPNEWGYWNTQFIQSGQAMSDLRARWCAEWFPLIAERISNILKLPIDLSYFPGWKSNTLENALLRSQAKERERRMTLQGPQRADLKVTIHGIPAGEVLSRGQQKLFIIALKLCQSEIVAQKTGQKVTYLIDDLPAELDRNHQEIVFEWLDKQESPLFLTSILSEDLLSDWGMRDFEDIHFMDGKLFDN